MPSRPSRITDLPAEAAHVINQLFREYAGRLDDIQKKLPARTFLKNTSTLAFGTVAAQSAAEATLFVPGANQQCAVHVSPTTAAALGSVHLSWCGYVISKDQVRIRVTNPTGAGVAVNTIPWNVVVTQ
jgi:hypothetical protein